MLELRPYQRECVNRVLSAYEEDSGYEIVVLPTGSGKTICFSYIIHEIQKKHGVNALIIAHRDELLNQAADKYRMINPSAIIGKVGSGIHEYGGEVTVASIQTICRESHIKKMQEIGYGLIIVDEAHHIASASYKKVLEALPVAFVLGVTATPERLDRKDIFKGKKPLYQTDIISMVKQGYLCNFRAIAIQTHVNIDNVKKSMGDFNEVELDRAINVPERNRLIVQKYKEYTNGKRAACFCVSVDHAEQMADAFNEAGVTSAVIKGSTPIEERAQIYEDFDEGKIKVLCSVMVLTEGWDCLDEETEILTLQGWKGIGKVKEGDLVYSLNRETGKMETTPVLDYVERYVNDGEKMATIKSQHVNIRTTEGHEFHIKYRDPKKGASENWLTKTGKQLAERRSPYILPLAAEMSNLTGMPLTDDEIRFIAWFMTDGGFVGTDVRISQAKEYHNEIRDLLQRLGLDYTERTRTNHGGFAGGNTLPLYEFRIPKGTANGSRKRNGWDKYAVYLDKKVSPLLHQMTRDQFIVFWEELMKGDGDQQKNKSGWLWCSNKEKADAYTHMAVIRGFASSCTEETTNYGNTVWRVSIRDAKWITSDPSDKRSARIHLEQPRENERVWCIRNKNSTIVTRRHGKIAIIGNCPKCEVIIMARPTQSRGLYIQMFGRGLRLAPGKEECVLLDITDNCKTHKLQSLRKAVEKENMRNGESLLEVIAREEKEEKEVQVRKLREKRLQDKQIDLFQSKPVHRFEWKKLDNGAHVIEVGNERHRIALTPCKGDSSKYYVAARLAPLFEYQRWTDSAMPFDEAKIAAEMKARKIIEEPNKAYLLDRNATWRDKPASEFQIKMLRWHNIPSPRGITSGQASDLIDAHKLKRHLEKQKIEA